MNSVPTPGAHGGDGAAVARALGVDVGDIVDLSLSLNPVAPDIRTVVGSHLDELLRYPDPARANAALAEAIGVDDDQVVVTNGGSEAIALAARLVGGGVAAEPEFGLHPRGEQGPRWRSNPHNPTGLLAPAGTRADVWDEAFYPLATGAWTRGDLDRGAIVIGSLTKVFACPGLRIGYLAGADVELVAAARAAQPHWSVNGLALAAVPQLLATARLAAWARSIAELRGQLVDLLAGQGLRARRSDVNWVLVDGAGDLRDRLAVHGVVVRDCATFGMPGTVRIAVPGPDGLARLDEALCRIA
ncbi:MAG: aminotransferase class I/II-fold pyridoxal phosphate-dependent enzyme [Actinomycetota bacterium]|nr:aminotransferase class I/II-fold pyridoxal phosphate-dependent enzyme [Actinomycetota bacterium]